MNTLIIDSPIKTFVIRKDKPDNYEYYALILQHNATGEVFVFNLMNDSADLRYFKFTIDMTSNPYGEYTYYIAGNNSEWLLNIDAVNIENSCYYSGIVYMGGIDSLVFSEIVNDFAITSENDGECLPLDFLGSCILQYFSFDNNVKNTCYTYIQHECCE